MFKKFAALSTAVFIVAAGLSTVAISAANATVLTFTNVTATSFTVHIDTTGYADTGGWRCSYGTNGTTNMGSTSPGAITNASPSYTFSSPSLNIVAATQYTVSCQTSPGQYLTQTGTVTTSAAPVLSSDATLSGATVKGVSATLGTPVPTAQTTSGFTNPGSVSITAAQAADTSNSGSFITSFATTDSGATISKVARYGTYSGEPSFSGTGGMVTDQSWNGTSAIHVGDFFVIHVQAADGTTSKYYLINVAITGLPSTDATLNLSASTIKGTTLTTESPNSSFNNLLMNIPTLTLTSAQAADTTNAGSFVSSFMPNESHASVVVVKLASGAQPIWSPSTPWSPASTLSSGDKIIIEVTAQDNSTSLFYGYGINVNGGGGFTPVTNTTISIPAPVAGNSPQTFAADLHNPLQWFAQAAVTWSPADATFQNGTAYTATFTISPNAGYIFTGLNSNSFSTPGATSTTVAFTSSSHGTVTIVFPAIGGSSSSSSSTPSAADLAAAAAHAAEVAEQKHEAAVAAARTSLTQLFAALPVVTAPATTSGTSTAAPSTGSTPASTPVTAPTLDQYAAADIHISSPAALARVNNDVAALPVAKRADITAIQSIVKTENFVDVISNATTQKTVTTVDLVNQGLIDPTNPNKASVVIGLTHLDPKTLNSVANIKAAIAAQLAIVQARKDRTAAILAKTQALIAKSPASK